MSAVITHADDSSWSKAFSGICLSVILSVCLSVCPHYNSKTNDPKVFKLGTGNDLGYLINDMVLGLKGQRSRSQGHKVQNILKAIEWTA